MTTKSLSRAGQTLPNVMEDFFRPWNEWLGTNNLFGKALTTPAVNVSETRDGYVVELGAPGLKKEDFDINVDGNILTISSEKEESKEEKETGYTRKEYNYSSFKRSFTMPEDIKQDKIEAEYTDGVLKLTLPRKDEAKKTAMSKHIAVK